MKTSKQITILALILSFVVFSCKHEAKFVFPQDENISDGSGHPKKRNVTYFPVEMASDSSVTSPIDTFHLKLYSRVLSKLGEPILYNYYIGRPEIRLTWIRPSGFPMTLSMVDVGGKIQLNENGFAPMSLMDIAKHPKDTVKRIYRAKSLTYENKKKLLELLNTNKFFEMPTNIGEKSLKGTQLAVEFHDTNNYHLVYRSISAENNPKEFKEICDYIIGLSNFSSENRY